jgi:cytochrome c oxidase subunit 2
MIINFFMFGFQDSATPVMEGIVDLHNHIFFYAVLIVVFVCKVFYDIIISNSIFMYNIREDDNKFSDFEMVKKSYEINKVGIAVSHHTLLEVVWTIIPTLILVSIAIPSFVLLYSMDEVSSPSLTIKAIGHQWYWSYEYSDIVDGNLLDVDFDSYMVSTNDLVLGQFRLLTVDNEIVLPVSVHFRVIVTATDVLHSWSVNSLGIKMDAVPGRLSQTTLFLKREGVFYGQCSELCGVNHGFMPIVVKSVSLNDYLSWVLSK